MRIKVYFILTVLLLSLGTLHAQEKKAAHQVSLGTGCFFESGSMTDSPGVALRLSYGCDIRLGGGWSVMPGVGVRVQKAAVGKWRRKGGSANGYACADAFFQVNYQPARDLVFGIGPVVSYALTCMKYDASSLGNPDSPLVGKDIYYALDFGIMPSILFPLSEHWRFGVEAIFGLRNLRIPYEETVAGASTRMNVILASAVYSF